MRRIVLGALVPLFLFVFVSVGQAQQEYLDFFIVKVKPEKRADFEAVTKKIVEANKHNKGDNWLTFETVYGEGNTVFFVSPRQSYAEIEEGVGRFMGALNKAAGPAGVAKMMQDFSNCVVSSRGEVRRRRWDLSSNVPSDEAGRLRIVGEAQWLRVTAVRVRPGRLAEYEAQLKENKAAFDNAKVTTLISQSAAGQQGTLFYFATLGASMGAFDKVPPTRQVLGEEAYKKYTKLIAEAVLTTETSINRFMPELSNAPEPVISAAPDFWRPKAKPAAAKPKVAAAAKPQP